MNEKAGIESRVVTGGAPLAQTLDGAALDKNGESNERHFSTDHLRTNLKHRTVSAGFVTLTSQGVKFVLTILSTYILARLLEKADFGLLAMVLTIMSLLRAFKDAGLSAATVQREGITHAQVSNLFWINVAVAGSMALIMAVSSPAIAWFYHQPSLVGITLWLSVTFLVSGSTVQHQALLRRQMRFTALAVIEIGSMLTSLIVGVVMALSGCRYWSLVGMNLTSEIAGFALTWTVSKWRPQRPRLGCGTRSLLNFGVKMTAGSVVGIFSRGVDTMLIGWRYGADATGLYSRAQAQINKPLDQLMSPVSAVFVPTLSRLQNEPVRYRRAFLQLFESIALVSFGFSGLFFALSHPVTLVLLGPKFEAAAVIFRSFTIAALSAPIATTVIWMLVSQGRGAEYMRMNVIMALTTISIIGIGLPFGPLGVATAYSAGGVVISLPVIFYLAGRSGPVTTKDLWSRFFRHLPLYGTVAGATMLTLLWAKSFSPLVQLLICGPIGCAAGAATIFVIKPQREIAQHFLKVVIGMAKAKLAAAGKSESTSNGRNA